MGACAGKQESGLTKEEDPNEQPSVAKVNARLLAAMDTGDLNEVDASLKMVTSLPDEAVSLEDIFTWLLTALQKDSLKIFEHISSFFHFETQQLTFGRIPWLLALEDQFWRLLETDRYPLSQLEALFFKTSFFHHINRTPSALSATTTNNLTATTTPATSSPSLLGFRLVFMTPCFNKIRLLAAAHDAQADIVRALIADPWVRIDPRVAQLAYKHAPPHARALTKKILLDEAHPEKALDNEIWSRYFEEGMFAPLPGMDVSLVEKSLLGEQIVKKGEAEGKYGEGAGEKKHVEAVGAVGAIDRYQSLGGVLDIELLVSSLMSEEGAARWAAHPMLAEIQAFQARIVVVAAAHYGKLEWLNGMVGKKFRIGRAALLCALRCAERQHQGVAASVLQKMLAEETPDKSEVEQVVLQ
eukprot:TRINITY_DN4687_c0_g3_i1.p1 TRINITY_DN4687_c0_g3~~TRINITY_DN4687_c0_g3_i1.p1  ORF type:complete len:413 (+),score=94.02 TRINITY_DN4687_c0_g3_i1:178-1416(+)